MSDIIGIKSEQPGCAGRQCPRGQIGEGQRVGKGNAVNRPDLRHKVGQTHRCIGIGRNWQDSLAGRKGGADTGGAYVDSSVSGHLIGHADRPAGRHGADVQPGLRQPAGKGIVGGLHRHSVQQRRSRHELQPGLGRRPDHNFIGRSGPGIGQVHRDGDAGPRVPPDPVG